MAGKRNRYEPSSDNFSKEEFPFYWLARLNNLYMLKMEKALKEVDADVPSWRVLNILKENGTSSISEITLHAVAKMSTITKIVYRMKSDGLVNTKTSAQDGRVTEVMLTTAGQILHRRMQQVTERIFEQGFHSLSEAQIQRLNGALVAIFDNLAKGD